MDKVKALKDGADVGYRYAHIKRDGYRLRITRAESGEIRVWTRKPQDWTAKVKALPRASTLWTRLSVPCILHAEIWAEKTPATNVISLVNAGSKDVKLSVFAIEKALPPDAPLAKVTEFCLLHGLDFVPYYCNASQGRDAGSYGTFTDLKSLPKPWGDVEGYVFKNGNMIDWQKWTPIFTVSLVVIGLRPGEGKYKGQVGSLVCADLTGREVCAISGFTDSQRKALSTRDIGRIVDVEYKNITAYDSLRMPRFVKFRDDLALEHIDVIGTEKEV